MTEGQKALNEWEMTQAEYRSLLESLLAKSKEYPVGFFHEAEDGFTVSRKAWGWSFEQKIEGLRRGKKLAEKYCRALDIGYK